MALSPSPPPPFTGASFYSAQARHFLAAADALVIGAGAGMSVGSGLRAYCGLAGRYEETDVFHASAEQFDIDPQKAAERARAHLEEQAAAVPHAGYSALLSLSMELPYGAAVIITNVDGMFARVGFTDPTRTPMYEVHGNLAWSQCLYGCDTPAVFPSRAPEGGVTVCPTCHRVARPNPLMFADFAFNDTRRARQWNTLGEWFDRLPETANVVVLEVGAGTTVPTIRRKCETFVHTNRWPLIRVNVDDLDCLTQPPMNGFFPLQGECADVLVGPRPTLGLHRSDPKGRRS